MLVVETRKDCKLCSHLKSGAGNIFLSSCRQSWTPHFYDLRLSIERVLRPNRALVLGFYALFRFEPLHDLYLRTTKMLLRWLISILMDTISFPVNLLNKLVAFLREFYQPQRCAKMDVLESINYKHMEKGLPFMGTICDRYLQNVSLSGLSSTSVSLVSVDYCEINVAEYWKHFTPC